MSRGASRKSTKSDFPSGFVSEISPRTPHTRFFQRKEKLKHIAMGQWRRRRSEGKSTTQKKSVKKWKTSAIGKFFVFFFFFPPPPPKNELLVRHRIALQWAVSHTVHTTDRFALTLNLCINIATEFYVFSSPQPRAQTSTPTPTVSMHLISSNNKLTSASQQASSSSLDSIHFFLVFHQIGLLCRFSPRHCCWRIFTLVGVSLTCVCLCVCVCLFGCALVWMDFCTIFSSLAFMNSIFSFFSCCKLLYWDQIFHFYLNTLFLPPKCNERIFPLGISRFEP